MIPRPSVTTILLTSAATLAYEVLLVRAFAIQYFNHFAFMAIGVAMLGIGVSGVSMALVQNLERNRALRWFSWSAVWTAAALILSPTLVDRVALEPTQMLWAGDQWVRLAAVYVLLATPFAFGALVVLLAVTAQPEHAGRLYGASFVGGAAGGAIALGVTAFVLPDRTLAIPALVAAAATATLVSRGRKPSWGLKLSTGIVAAAALTAFVRPFWHVDVSLHKALPQIAAFPQAERLQDRAGIGGWTTSVRSPAYRHAPGLSLLYRGSIPSQTALFVDGDLVGAVSDPSGSGDFYDWLPTAAPYAIAERRSVLVMNAGGGSEVGNALRHGAQRVVGVESHSGIVDLIADLTARPDANSTPKIEWVSEQPRTYAANTRDRFALVTLEPTGGLGASTGGMHSLNEDFLHTVDAYTSFLNLLEPDGVLSITRWLSVPPRETIRLIFTAGRALRMLGVDPGTSMLVLRSWATVTVVVKRNPFTIDEIVPVRAWAETRGFDFDWYPGIPGPESRFHEMDEPVIFAAATASASGGQQVDDFVETYPFDVSPVSDARPYPNHFLRLSDLKSVVGAGAGTSMPFAELGLVAVMATLAQSLLLGCLFMLVPPSIAAIRHGQRVSPRIAAYFASIGLGYMVVEIAAIQQLTLLLGRPHFAVTAVLVSFLVCSGIGSARSDMVRPTRATMFAFGLAGLVTFYAVFLLPVVHFVQPAPMIVRALAALIVIAPVAFIMGFPFALGLRLLAGTEGVDYAWAWAANGFASVVATPLAAVIALEIGTSWLFAVGAFAYVLAGLTGRTGHRRIPVLTAQPTTPRP